MWFQAALVALLAAHGADVATTMAALHARPAQVREANPVFAPLAGRPAVFGAIVMGSAGATSWALVRVHKRHPRLACWIAAGGAVGLVGVARHNARLVRE